MGALFENATGCALTTNHTTGSVHTIEAGTPGVWVSAKTADLWMRFGVAGIAGTDVQTPTEDDEATDWYIQAGLAPFFVGCPRTTTRVAFRSAADPGGTAHCVPDARGV